jgi:hypothetical protein
MNHAAQKPLQTLANTAQISRFLHQLQQHLLKELNEGQPFTDNRARTLLRALGFFDEAIFNDFSRLVESEAYLRVAVYDLLDSGELAIEPMNFGADSTSYKIEWLPLLIAIHAYKTQYPINNLDPSSPPAVHTPAGLLLQQAAGFMRRQVQRSATERDRLAKQLLYQSNIGSTPAGTPNWGDVSPAPPHFRVPVPVRYPEYNPPVNVDPTETEPSQIDITPPIPPLPADTPRGPQITISRDELNNPPAPAAKRMPSIKITRDQVVPPQVKVGQPVPIPRPQPAGSSPGFTESLRKMFSSEKMKNTKLRVLVQDYPDGPGVYGLQVKVSCKGIRSFVAGTTDQNGSFLCELPVREHSGLTYDVEVVWPREEGGQTEQKAITLSADRTQFQLPFYRRLKA